MSTDAEGGGGGAGDVVPRVARSPFPNKARFMLKKGRERAVSRARDLARTS